MEESECLNEGSPRIQTVATKYENGGSSKFGLCSAMFQVVCALVSAIAYLCIGLVRSWASTGVPR